MKIPVLHYVEVTSLTSINDLPISEVQYLVNESDKLYLVEVWA